MPIFPRYDVPRGEFPTPRYPVLPADSTIGDVFSSLAAAGLRVTAAMSEHEARKQKLEDTTLLSQRMVQAEKDLDGVLAGIQSDRRQHATAPEQFETFTTKRERVWTEGLRPELAATLTKQLTPRIIQGLRDSRQIKNKFVIDEAHASLVGLETMVTDHASRLAWSDGEALGGLYTLNHDPDTGTVTKVPGPIVDRIAGFVAAGSMTRTEGETWLKTQTGRAAFARLQRMTVSDNPDRAIHTLDAEEREPGTTFARDIPASERNTLRGDAMGKLRALRAQQRQDDEDARVSAEREVTKMQKATAVEFSARLDAGTLTKEDVIAASRVSALEQPKMEFFLKAIETRDEEGSSTSAVVRELTSRSFNVNENPLKMQAEVEQAFVAGHLRKSQMIELRTRLAARYAHDTDPLRGEARDLLKQRHNHVESLMRTVLPVSGGSSPLLNQIGQQTLGLALEDLGRNSLAMTPRGTDPVAWWDANQNRYLQAVAANGTMRVTQGRALLPLSLQGVTQLAELKTHPGFLILTQQEKRDTILAIQDLLDLESALRARATPGGNASSPQSTKGVSQGPASERKAGAPPPVGKR